MLVPSPSQRLTVSPSHTPPFGGGEMRMRDYTMCEGRPAMARDRGGRTDDYDADNADDADGALP
ncbi:hypothetical protein GCM10017557_15750 [Streptomyces aurantiacus]|uniref:Uncharacterized protein n=1 Tax=Streptomyces aurantiacus TaxID=47760 RepID=A0A7G1NYV7_9ACTN|nr:hypothetical protein GCM10017557_15750 [Streptomyces aurantiacus]